MFIGIGFDLCVHYFATIGVIQYLLLVCLGSEV